MPSPNTEGGWGTPHQNERKRWAALLDQGTEHSCAKCGQRVYSSDAWDLGHTTDRTGWTGPEHRSCNRRDGAQRRHEAMIIRQW